MSLTKVQDQVINASPRDGLTNVMIPTVDGGWRDIYRAGWTPAGFNQQWGGSQWGAEMVDGATGNLYKFSVETGYVEENDFVQIGYAAAGGYYRAASFKTSTNITLASIWVKLYKTGTANRTVQFYIYSDTAGTPNALITNGTAVSINLQQLTSKTDGEWYRLTFPIPPSLTGNTTYHIVGTQSISDGTNFVCWKALSANKRYPFGYLNSATSGFSWTPTTTLQPCFLIEGGSSDQYLQPTGQFDAKLVGTASTQPGQVKALCQPMTNFFDGRHFTYLQRGNWAVSSTIADFVYGLDHDRIRVYTDASGFVNVTLYAQNRSTYTVTGTTSVVAGFHDVGIRVRAHADGADTIEVWVDGVLQASTSGQTFVFDALMRDSGTAWIGGGFPAIPVWTQDMQMATLPSAQGWTYTGSSPTTESLGYSIQNNKLFQNKNGFGVNQDGFYQKSSLGLVNATGWTISFKVRVGNDNNTTGNGTVFISISDGSKGCFISVHEYYLQFGETIGFGGSKGFYQSDFKSKDRVITVCGKGSDAFVYVDGKLVIDMTGNLTTASATNSIIFGDVTTISNESSDAIWSYVKYYNGGSLLPTAAVGTVQEAAYWAGNKVAAFPVLWAGGNYLNLKKYLGLSKNYVENIVQKEQRAGITNQPTTTSNTPVILPEMEAFVIGSKIVGVGSPSLFHDTAGQVAAVTVSIDGSNGKSLGYIYPGGQIPGGIGYSINNSTVYLGLHKVENRFGRGTAGTASSFAVYRQFHVEASS